jgi:UDP-glucose 4-epimerase
MADHPLARRSVLITGATGFMGTHLARALVHLGAQVHALHRAAGTTLRLPCDAITWHQADVTAADTLRTAVDRTAPDVVFHLAAYGTTYDQQDENLAYRTNVEGSWHLWQALRGSACRLVYVGTCGEYGRASGQVTEDHVCQPTWFYPATKLAATVLLATLGAQSGQPVVILRPFGPYGPADHPSRVIPQVIRALLRGEEVPVTAGEQRRDYTYVDDHVDALLRAATCALPRSGAIYNIGSGAVVTLRAVIESIAHAVGNGALQRVRFGALPYRDTEVWEMCCCIDAARRDLGFAPRVSLEAGIERTVAWYREHTA